MTDYYLTPHLKQYYLNAYQEVKDSTNEFWKLDEGISMFLEKINTNPNIQTIYSKRGPYMGGFGLFSYIAFAYTKNVELKLFRQLIPRFISKYNEMDNSECVYRYVEPYTREDKREKGGLLELACIVDPDYFNVHHIRLELTGGGPQTHDEFWSNLSEGLSTIGL